MKRIITIVTGMTFFLACTGQKSPVDASVKSELLEKSKRQKNIAVATGIPGVLMLTAGGALILFESGNAVSGSSEYDEKKLKTGKVLLLVGSGLTLVSISFAIASKKNKKQAALVSASLKFEKTYTGMSYNIDQASYPSIALQIRF